MACLIQLFEPFSNRRIVWSGCRDSAVATIKEWPATHSGDLQSLKALHAFWPNFKAASLAFLALQSLLV